MARKNYEHQIKWMPRKTNEREDEKMDNIGNKKTYIRKNFINSEDIPNEIKITHNKIWPFAIISGKSYFIFKWWPQNDAGNHT